MIESITEAQVRVNRLADLYDAALALIEPDLVQDTQTQQQVGTLQANMAGLLGELRGFRKDLDATDSPELIATQQNAARLLAVWIWERDTRAAVGDFAIVAIQTRDLARKLNEGSDRSTVTVREGETLQSIAQRELGDFQAWPRILDANPGLLPGVLVTGTTLILPEKR